MTCAQGLLRLLWGGPEVGVLRDCVRVVCSCYSSMYSMKLLQCSNLNIQVVDKIMETPNILPS